MQDCFVDKEGVTKIKLGSIYHEWSLVYPRAVSYFETKHKELDLEVYRKTVFAAMCKLKTDIAGNVDAVTIFFEKVVEIAHTGLAIAKAKGKAKPKAKAA